MEIGKKIHLLRKKAGITQEQLAGQLQVSRQTISKWESGVSLPDIESVVAIGKLFQVSLDDLLKETSRDVVGEKNNADNPVFCFKEEAQRENAVSFQYLEELVKINHRNRLMLLVVFAFFIFALGIVFGSIFTKKLDHTTSKLEYTLHQYMELEGKVTALVDTNAKEQVLLVTDTTYDDGTGRQVTCICEVYYAINNKVKALGTIMSAGTAYPIAIDRTGIYTASGHSVERYIIKEETGELELAEAVYEIYDKDGNVTYEKEVDGVRSLGREEDFMEMVGAYGRATNVRFQ